LKSCLFTVAPGCWVTSTNDNSSVACGVTWTVASCNFTVPVTAVAAGAGVPAPDADAAALADELSPEELDAPQPARTNVARNSGATASFCMRVPRNGAGPHRTVTPRSLAFTGQNFHVTASRGTTKAVVRRGVHH